MKRKKVLVRNDNFPGPKAKKVITEAGLYYATTTVKSEFVPAKGQGVMVRDVDGNKFIDFVSGVGVANAGYGNPGIIEPMLAHLKNTGIINLIHHDFHNPWTIDLAKRMARDMELYFEALGEKQEFKMFFANSGAEIVEAAMKLVWDNRPERPKIIGFKAAFHGRTMGAWLFLTKLVHIKKYPSALRPFVIHLTFPKDEKTFNEFQKEIKGLALIEYGSIFLEIIQGEGGLNPLYPPAAEFIQKELVEKNGLYLVIDEVQTGNGRTGKYLAFEHYPVLRPTIVVTAKGAASGMPFGAMWLPREMDWKERGRHSSTFGGNALAAITAGATLDFILGCQLVKRTEELGKILKAELLKTEREFSCIRNIRGFGLMQGFDIVDEEGLPSPSLRDKIESEAPHWGLILMGCGESGIRILPPLVITEEELREGLERLKKAIEYVK